MQHSVMNSVSGRILTRCFCRVAVPVWNVQSDWQQQQTSNYGGMSTRLEQLEARLNSLASSSLRPSSSGVGSDGEPQPDSGWAAALHETRTEVLGVRVCVCACARVWGQGGRRVWYVCR
jgi:hypothetical protein